MGQDVFIGACIGVGKAACYLTVLPELLALAGRISLYEQVAALAIASAAWLTLVISRYAVIKQQKDNFPVKKWCETAATFSRTKTGSGGRRGDDDDDKLKEKRKNLVISPIEVRDLYMILFLFMYYVLMYHVIPHGPSLT